MGLVLTAFPASAQPRSVVEGHVTAPDGRPLAYANVQIVGTLAGAATDTTGFFRFTAPQTGPHRLRSTSIGFAPTTRRVRLAPGDTVRVRLTLSAAPVALREATVTASAYTVRGTDATMGPLEAVTTPGAMGDLFRALQSFPGVAQAGDGAGLYVRGGDLSETKTLVDQATLRHPYRYESPAGGSFGTIRPFLAEGTTFSTGGFSAQYGDALSGVLAIDTKDRPDARRLRGNAGLAAVSVGVDAPLLEDRLGLRLSGNRSFTGVLFRLNGQNGDFETVPQGLDGTLSLTYDYASGQLKALSFARRNRMGVQTAEGAFRGLFRNRSTNQLHSLQWTAQRTGLWTGRTSVAYSRYGSREQFGALDLEPEEAAYQLRSDWDRALGPRSTLSGGVVAMREQSAFRGTFPAEPGQWDQAAARVTVDDRLAATRIGGYLEGDASLGERLRVIGGLRADHHTRAAQTTVDPRLAVEYQLSERTRARLAWGRFHQAPALETYAQHVGPNRLGAQQAQHAVATVRYQRGPLQLRLAGYLKPYRDLVVPTGEATYANAGSGIARGVDAFAKYGGFLETRLSGWAAYSFVQSRRTQVRQRGADVTLERGPAPFDFTHQFTAVGKMRVVDMLFAAGTVRHTTGRPITPVVGAVPQGDGTYAPIEGPVGSERLPAYRRLDLQLSYYIPLGPGQHLTVYAAVNNALDRANVIDITYAPDYRSRTEQTTSFRRSVYAGLTMTL
jgi:hypothetical protein